MNSLNVTEVRELLVHCLKRGERLEWLEWLPVAAVAANQPVELVQGYNALDAEKRGEFLMLLRSDQAGPLAELILMTFGASTSLIEDEQDRDFVLEDARDANLRIGRRTKAMQEACSVQMAQVGMVEERLNEGFDLAGEVVRMEGRLAELRMAECDRGGEFARIHELEIQILRLEAHKRILDRYDREARIIVRDGLVPALEEGKRSKDELEQEIAGMIAEQAAMEQKRADLQAEQASLSAGHEQFRSELERDQKAVKELGTSIEQCRLEIGQLRDEHSRLLTEAARLELLQRDARELVGNARNKLDELVHSAEESGQNEIVTKIKEVYALLPQDLADQGRR